MAATAGTTEELHTTIPIRMPIRSTTSLIPPQVSLMHTYRPRPAPADQEASLAGLAAATFRYGNGSSASKPTSIGLISQEAARLLAIHKWNPTGFYTSTNDTGTANERASVRWLSTVRARGGFALQQNLLLYGTGGFAFGGVSTQGSVTTSSPFPGFFNPAWSGSSSTVKVGGVLGAGLEWAIYEQCTIKAEYLWYDMGSSSHPLNCTPATCTNGAYATLGNVSTSISGSIVRVGVNYKFH